MIERAGDSTDFVPSVKREFLEGTIAEHIKVCDDCETHDGKIVEPCERLLYLRDIFARRFVSVD